MYYRSHIKLVVCAIYDLYKKVIKCENANSSNHKQETFLVVVHYESCKARDLEYDRLFNIYSFEHKSLKKIIRKYIFQSMQESMKMQQKRITIYCINPL